MPLGSWVVLGESSHHADIGARTREIMEDPFCGSLAGMCPRGQRLVYSDGAGTVAALTQDFVSSRRADVVVVRYEDGSVYLTAYEENYLYWRDAMDRLLGAGPAERSAVTEGMVPARRVRCGAWNETEPAGHYADILRLAMLQMGFGEGLLQGGDEG